MLENVCFPLEPTIDPVLLRSSSPSDRAEAEHYLTAPVTCRPEGAKDRMTTSKWGISREEAVELMEQYLETDALRKHSLATEAIMRSLRLPALAKTRKCGDS